VAIAGLLATAFGAHAQLPALGPESGLRARCHVYAPTQAVCDFHLGDPADVLAVRASVGGRPVGVPSWDPYPTPRSVTAVLFLVDTSALGVAGGAGIIRQDIEALVEQASPHIRFGLGAFDSELRLIVPVGEPRAAVREALEGLQPTSRATELYRNALEAIRTLAGISADRRALVLVSDGAAEDRAYFHQDVTRAAEGTGIVVNGMGYSQGASRSVALQTLRRLSEETGGVFLAQDASGRIPKESLGRPLGVLESGGTARLDFTAAGATGITAPPHVELTVETSRGALSTVAALGRGADPQAGAPRPQPAPGPASPLTPRDGGVSGPTAADESGSGHTPALWLLLAALGAGGAYAWRQSGRRRLAGRSATTGEPQLHGYLLFRDHPEREHCVISQSTLRIGRQNDNDLVLDDTSVSRHHAEIRIGRDATPALVDLDSLNGVYVNDRQVKSARLQDGDAIEIGDVRLLFTRSPQQSGGRRHDPLTLEKTVAARPEEILGPLAR
jgi:hypothetical protein